ncbi:MAG: ABC transporter permease subunit [Pseudomonadota bacterium]
MLRYAITRLFSAIPTLLLVIALAFMMVHAAPGGPFDSERVLPPEIEANLEDAYNLNDPLLVQFAKYLGGLLRGDLGPSFRYTDYSVNQLIAEAAPVSMQLGIAAMVVALSVGVALGVAAAMRPNTWLDRSLMALAMTGISIPIFVIAPVLVLVLAVQLQWLPAGWTGNSGGARFVLPIIALALPQIAYIARLTRGSMLDVLASDFVRTAIAQGIGRGAVIRSHALKPALLPVLSYLGPALAAILTGSIVVEEVFGISGLGQLFVRSATNRDYTLVLGVVILYATLIIVFNLLVDIAYGYIDPRVRKKAG